MTILRAPDSDAVPPPPPLPRPFPVFPVYYLWWEGNPVTQSSSNWRHLGNVVNGGDGGGVGPSGLPYYPYNQRPNPLPATVSADETTITNLYEGNHLLDISNGFAYRQDLPNVVEDDVNAAQAIGCAGFAVNWAAPSQANYTGRLVRALNQADALIAAGRDFRIMLDYKGEGTRPASTVISDMNWFLDNHGSRPCIYELADKPVIVWTGSWDYPVETWQAVSDAIRPRATLLGGQPWSSYNTIAPYVDGNAPYWSTQDPYRNPNSFQQLRSMAATIHAAGKFYGAPVNGGYDDRIVPNRNANYIPRRDGETLDRVWDGNMTGDPHFLYFMTWNEIIENSHWLPGLTRFGDYFYRKLEAKIASTVPAVP